MSMHKTTTLHDVARAAGVSYGTVSRVLNQHPHVAPGTRARVLDTIEALDYRPNRAARSLVTSRTNTIGIVSFGARYYGPSQMMSNIERALRERGYALTIASIDAVTEAELRRAAGELLHYQVDGIVMITPIRGLGAEAIGRLTGATPFVMVDVDLGSDLPSIVIDQGAGAELAVDHLVALGHRAIAQLHGPADWVDAHARGLGFEAALRRAGLRPLATVEGDWSAASGYRAARELLAGQALPSALFAHNDQMALGALHALREAGLRVPRDVSVVGYDDVPEASFYAPPLTTVRQDFSALGSESVDYLGRLLADRTTPVHQRVLHPELRVRASTAPLEAT